MATYYLDTCVWIALFDFEDPEHENVVKLFKEVELYKDVIVVSWVHIQETKSKGYYEVYEEKKNGLYKKGLCIGEKGTELDRQIALKNNEFLQVGYDDCLHMQIAKRVKAKPVSFDSHWQKIGKKYNVRVYKPSDLI